MVTRILLVDDDPHLVPLIQRGLAYEGFEVYTAMDGESGLAAARAHQPHIVLLDIAMSGLDGFEVCRRLRLHDDIAIIMLTVRNTEADKVEALDAGADDFVTKPFSTPELLARIRAALRRVPMAAQGSPARISVGPLIVDFTARAVTIGSTTTRLTPKELDLLRYLTQRANQAVPHRELLQAVWGPDYGDQVEYLRVFIKNLRRKIEPNSESPEYIITEPWIGYRFNGDPQPL